MSILGEGVGFQNLLIPLIDIGRLRPGHNREPGQPRPRRDQLVRLVLPRSGPSQSARQGSQAPPVLGVEPGQTQVRCATFPALRSLVRRKLIRREAERDERIVYVNEKQRTPTRAKSHRLMLAVSSGLRPWPVSLTAWKPGGASSTRGFPRQPAATLSDLRRKSRRCVNTYRMCE